MLCKSTSYRLKLASAFVGSVEGLSDVASRIDVYSFTVKKNIMNYTNMNTQINVILVCVYLEENSP